MKFQTSHGTVKVTKTSGEFESEKYVSITHVIKYFTYASGFSRGPLQETHKPHEKHPRLRTPQNSLHFHLNN